jgi:SNF family Na+-dependent transporter
MVNQWGEVILGSTIAIPIAYAFLGPQATMDVSQGGAFILGFATMSVVLQQLPWHVAFGTAWFSLLLIAGTLSQLALMQPLIPFLQDGLGWRPREAVTRLLLVVFLRHHVLRGPQSLQARSRARRRSMTPLGWLFLTTSWAVLTFVTVWCFVKIWQAPFQPEKKPHEAARDSPSQTGGTKE